MIQHPPEPYPEYSRPCENRNPPKWCETPEASIDQGLFIFMSLCVVFLFVRKKLIIYKGVTL